MPSRRFFTILLLALAAAVVALTAGSLVLAGGTRSAHMSTANGANLRFPNVQSALEYRLHQRYLDYRWVLCSPTHTTFQGQRLSRCNVNFGEPHIVPYCAVLLHGKLLTDHEDRAINCGSRLKAEEQDLSVNVR